MTPTEQEILKEIEDITKMETSMFSFKPEEVKKINSKAICLFGDKDLRQILRKADSMWLEGYQLAQKETAEKVEKWFWKHHSRNFIQESHLKELKEIFKEKTGAE
jgi:hypothetical protein